MLNDFALLGDFGTGRKTNVCSSRDLVRRRLRYRPVSRLGPRHGRLDVEDVLIRLIRREHGLDCLGHRRGVRMSAAAAGPKSVAADTAASTLRRDKECISSLRSSNATACTFDRDTPSAKRMVAARRLPATPRQRATSCQTRGRHLAPRLRAN